VSSDVPFGSGVVAVTKLLVPEPRASLVPRDALVARLGTRDDSRLTLVTGPAGAGKTTLVQQWHAARSGDVAFAWLALDPEDGDPVRFWGLVIAALRSVHPGFGAAAATALRAGRGAIAGAVVPEIVNAAAALPGRTVLVLDDLHVLAGAGDVHAELGQLVDRLPPPLHLAVTSRVLPEGLPVARLRVRGQLDEVDAADLRFSDADAAALLRRGFAVELAGAQVARLQTHVEGWAAGLQLAGISLGRRGVDFDAFIAAIGAPGADAPAYLAAEVLDGQPEAVRAFLLRTAILDRLSNPLCAEVAGEEAGAITLDDLARRNLLLEPVDARRTWWRYHQLFADLLRAEARATLGDAALAELHRRAAAWHRAHGDPGEAIRHALAGGQPAVAAQLVADHWEERFNRGELRLVAGWLERLPTDELARDPRLWLARLWTAMDRGRLDEAQAQLAVARSGATPAVRAWGLLLLALHAFKRGDVTAAGRGLADAVTVVDDDPFRQTVTEHVRGLVARAEGRAGLAVASFTRAAALATGDGNRLGQAYAVGYLALLAADAGDAEAARERLAEVAVLREEDAAIGEHFVAAVAALALGRTLAAEGAYEAAVPALEHAAELAARGAGLLEQAEPALALAEAQRARGRRPAAEAALHEARERLAACAAPGRLADRLRRLERELRLPVPEPAREALTDGERTVLALLPGPLSQREIGEELFISINTVKTHCRNIYIKLDAASREQAVGRARELGLLPADA
jgi:LuxR family transcriptional regulator, maltose regulon positive regulatory protein